MLKFRYYLLENGKDFLEDTANILCGLGEQTQIATRYTSKPSLFSCFNIVLVLKLLFLMVKRVEVQRVCFTPSEVAETTISTGYFNSGVLSRTGKLFKFHCFYGHFS